MWLILDKTEVKEGGKKIVLKLGIAIEVLLKFLFSLKSTRIYNDFPDTLFFHDISLTSPACGSHCYK